VRIYYSIKHWLGCHILGKHLFVLRGFTSLNYKGVNIVSGELTKPEKLQYCYWCGKENPDEVI
jgi:hypothetical protein